MSQKQFSQLLGVNLERWEGSCEYPGVSVAPPIIVTKKPKYIILDELGVTYK